MKLWDLRKLKNFKTITLDNNYEVKRDKTEFGDTCIIIQLPFVKIDPPMSLYHVNNFSQVKSLVFDQSGTYLAVGGSDIRVYICKQWSEVLNFTGEEHFF